MVKLEAVYKKYGANQSKPLKPASAVNSGVSASGGHPVKASEVVKTIKIVEIMSPTAVTAEATVQQSSNLDAVDA